MRQSAACVLPACAVKRIARVHLLLACGEARCVSRATGTLLARTAVRVARVQLLPLLTTEGFEGPIAKFLSAAAGETQSEVANAQLKV